ncbi:MAG: hypoxanthine phosphoribosyltransferase [Verrucomicrobia bacterium]|nr:hypoxanthine phosphoribosyltransferase [Verrucomicrobiota bacterium]MBV9272648.1 hypoxanthine phosphoribosyltransferase [Verrucomicrobiota bacterium]
MHADLDRVLFREDEIARRLDTLASEITTDYMGKELTVLAILNGSLIFMADLLRRIPLPLELDCLRVRSYYDEMESSGQVSFDRSALPKLADRHVLLLDDILDSGQTLAAIVEAVREDVKPLSIRSCVLLRKIKTRARPIEADYVGFNIGDEFVVGYGLDYQERYRNLSVIGVLRKP